MTFFRRKSLEPLDVGYGRAEEVHMSLVQMRTAMNALPNGVVIMSSNGTSRWSNRAIYGLFPAGSSDFVVFTTQVDALLKDALRGRGGGAVLEFGDPVVRTFQLESIALVDGGAAVLAEDITPKIMIDRVRTDFVANISHELRTPIGAISLMAENLVEEMEGSESARIAEIILSEVTRLNNTLSDLLELARIEFDGLAQRQPVEVPRVIEEAVGRIRSAALARSVMIVVGRVPDVSISGDRAQLVSAIGNLIDNAVKYSSDGSIVKIEVARLENQLVISVSDNGSGIAAEHLPRIFERFYRVDDARSRATGGTGLGLAIVRHIALLHGGEITVNSELDKGTTFALSLPAM